MPDRAEVHAVLEESNAYFHGAVVTELQTLRNYSSAEAYHQDYFEHHPDQGYCAHVVAPKVQKFMKTFVDRVRHA